MSLCRFSSARKSGGIFSCIEVTLARTRTAPRRSERQRRQGPRKNVAPRFEGLHRIGQPPRAASLAFRCMGSGVFTPTNSFTGLQADCQRQVESWVLWHGALASRFRRAGSVFQMNHFRARLHPVETPLDSAAALRGGVMPRVVLPGRPVAFQLKYPWGLRKPIRNGCCVACVP
jgi:hypothetical protein